MTPEKALQYDKRLSLKINLDGSKILCRLSPYNAERNHEIKMYENTYLGSGRWLRDSLIKMDTQRHSIVHDALQNNKKIRDKQTHDPRMGRDVAEMFAAGGDTFIN